MALAAMQLRSCRKTGRRYSFDSQPAWTGLLGRADRAAAFDGQIQVESPRGLGTPIVATLPLPP